MLATISPAAPSESLSFLVLARLNPCVHKRRPLQGFFPVYQPAPRHFHCRTARCILFQIMMRFYDSYLNHTENTGAIFRILSRTLTPTLILGARTTGSCGIFFRFFSSSGVNPVEQRLLYFSPRQFSNYSGRFMMGEVDDNIGLIQERSKFIADNPPLFPNPHVLRHPA